MGELKDRLDKLEQDFGIVSGKEPATYEEFLEQYPDYEELSIYFHEILDSIYKAKEKFLPFPECLFEAVKTMKSDPRYVNDKRLQRANRCSHYRYELDLEHRKKAAVINEIIKRLFPDYDEQTRLEGS